MRSFSFSFLNRLSHSRSIFTALVIILATLWASPAVARSPGSGNDDDAFKKHNSKRSTGSAPENNLNARSFNHDISSQTDRSASRSVTRSASTVIRPPMASDSGGISQSSVNQQKDVKNIILAAERSRGRNQSSGGSGNQSGMSGNKNQNQNFGQGNKSTGSSHTIQKQSTAGASGIQSMGSSTGAGAQSSKGGSSKRSGMSENQNQIQNLGQGNKATGSGQALQKQSTAGASGIQSMGSGAGAGA